MKNLWKKAAVLLAAVLMLGMTVAGCSSSSSEPVELTIAAAASLTDVMADIQTAYADKEPNVTLHFTFASSGSLQTQIEQGAGADIFISAALKQMKTLQGEGLLLDDSYTELLENKVVLIVPSDSTAGITSFDDVNTDKVSMIGIGEPSSVPAGSYAKQVFTTLGTWDAVSAKANYGSDVRTVLTWVENGEVDCGVVYATDAMTSDNVKVVAEAPEGSCDKSFYPGAIVASSANADAAQDFLDFLTSKTAVKIFESYGFTVIEQ